MKKKIQNGFSLIELLLVVTIIGIISAIALPNLFRGKLAAENASAISTLRIIHGEQITFFAQKNRYARLDELNAQRNGSLGIWTAPDLRVGNYNYRMNPSTPTDIELQTEYIIVATRTSSSPEPYLITVNQTGIITQVSP